MEISQELAVFATAESTRARAGETNIEHALRTYCPSFPGVHVCGADHEDNRFFTVVDFPMPDSNSAVALWAAIKSECAVLDDERDYTVDLNTSDGHGDDFPTNRQMLPRLYAIALEMDLRTLATQGATS